MVMTIVVVLLPIILYINQTSFNLSRSDVAITLILLRLLSFGYWLDIMNWIETILISGAGRIGNEGIDVFPSISIVKSD
jgi:hypothetical protein